MINILLEGYRFDADWLYGALKSYIKPHHRVAVVALSFRDSRVKNAEEWEHLYGKERGSVGRGICSAFSAYGIGEESISFINYFTDSKVSAAKKIRNADIVFFPGGVPDKMMERIYELGLYDVLCEHNGIVMGYSAGALIQLSEYHLSPDHDYPVFAYYKGLPYLGGFCLEVHYEGRDVQKEAIKRVISERRMPVYATSLMKGAIVVDNGKIQALGDVFVFGDGGEE